MYQPAHAHGFRRAVNTVLFLIIYSNQNVDARSSLPAPGYREVPVAELMEFGQVPNRTGSAWHDNQVQLQLSSRCAQTQLHNSDFVFATGICRERTTLAHAGRVWRHGIRSFTLTNHNETDTLIRLNAEGTAYNESYAFFPDDGDPLLGRVFHGKMRGDTRAAVAPFAAHRHYGDTYKYLLYGDDDTLFYMDAVKRMLAGFDPDLPLAISDHLWYNRVHPNPHAPRCLPCHLANESLPTLQEIMHAPPMREAVRRHLAKSKPGANVSEDELEAELNSSQEVPGHRFVPRPACPYCTPKDACAPVAGGEGEEVKCTHAGAHGGVGMIFSVGLLRRISLEQALECFSSYMDASGGDALVSACLWRYGIAFTDPGPLVRHLYDPHYVVFGGGSNQGFLWDPVGYLTHGRCDGKCKWVLRNAVSLHVRRWSSYKPPHINAMNMRGVAYAREAALDYIYYASPAFKDLPFGADPPANASAAGAAGAAAAA